jgi:hypothetical protein
MRRKRQTPGYASKRRWRKRRWIETRGATPRTVIIKMSRNDAVSLASNFYLERYFRDVNAPKFAQLNVGNPEFFKQINAVLESSRSIR